MKLLGQVARRISLRVAGFTERQLDPALEHVILREKERLIADPGAWIDRWHREQDELDKTILSQLWRHFQAWARHGDDPELTMAVNAARDVLAAIRGGA